MANLKMNHGPNSSPVSNDRKQIMVSGRTLGESEDWQEDYQSDGQRTDQGGRAGSGGQTIRHPRSKRQGQLANRSGRDHQGVDEKGGCVSAKKVLAATKKRSEELRAAIDTYDRDGDGMLDADELGKVFDDVLDTKLKNKHLKYGLLGLLMMCVLLLVSTFASLYAALEISRKITTDEGGNKMVSATTGEILKTKPEGGGSIEIEPGEQSNSRRLQLQRRLPQKYKPHFRRGGKWNEMAEQCKTAIITSGAIALKIERQIGYVRETQVKRMLPKSDARILESRSPKGQRRRMCKRFGVLPQDEAVQNGKLRGRDLNILSQDETGNGFPSESKDEVLSSFDFLCCAENNEDTDCGIFEGLPDTDGSMDIEAMCSELGSAFGEVNE